MSTDYDVVVVGSGFGGAIPALRLAQDGRKVLCLEWGQKWTARDFKQSFDLRYLMNFYSYKNDPDYKFFVRYARMLGGGSMIFSGAMYRSPSEVFGYRDRKGYQVWPSQITRKVLDPYYDKVDRMMKINQVGWDDVPRSGGIFAKMVDRMGLTCDRGCYNYVDCKGCGFCEAGCVFDRKVTLVHSYIPAAERLGAEFRTRCYVTGVKPRTTAGYQVSYRDAWERQQSVTADLVLLAGGGVETPAILMRSTKDLPKLSPALGQHYNNNGDIAFAWLLPDTFEPFHLYMGRDNAGMMCYAFWKEHQITFHPGGPPPAVIAGLELHRPGELAWGLEHKQMMKKYYDGRMVVALAIGMLDGLGEVKLDSAGLPTVHFPPRHDTARHARDNAYLKKYLARVEGVAKKIADANGAELIYTAPDGYEHGDAHCLASARMGSSRQQGVCNPHGEVYDYPGLFITDSAGIPGGTGVNPAHTIAANAERIADYIVQNKK